MENGQRILDTISMRIKNLPKIVPHPDQPLVRDSTGVIRFKENKIVRHLVDSFLDSLNAISIMNFPKEDYQQLMQLIGYSVCGYCDLSSVAEESKDKNWELMEKFS